MLDAPTNEYRVRTGNKRTESAADIPTAPRQTPTKRALEINGYWGKRTAGGPTCLKVSWWVSSISSGSTGNGYNLYRDQVGRTIMRKEETHASSGCQA